MSSQRCRLVVSLRWAGASSTSPVFRFLVCSVLSPLRSTEADRPLNSDSPIHIPLEALFTSFLPNAVHPLLHFLFATLPQTLFAWSVYPASGFYFVYMRTALAACELLSFADERPD